MARPQRGRARSKSEAAAEKAPAWGSLKEDAYERLEEMIITLELPPGAPLSEQALSARLGIGRTPVREALLRLRFEGLVDVIPRRGVIVTEIDVRQQLLVHEFRCGAERLIASRAARRADEAERGRFAELAGIMTAASMRGDLAGFMGLDRQLDELMDRAARNPVASRAVAPGRIMTRRFGALYFHRHADHFPNMVGHHVAVARAIAAGDEAAASAAMDRLMDYVEVLVRATLTDGF